MVRPRFDAWALKALYDALAGPVLGVTLAVAGLAWVLHLLAVAGARLAGAELDAVWEGLGAAAGVDDAWFRLVGFGAAHALIVGVGAGPATRAVARLRRGAPARRSTRKPAKGRTTRESRPAPALPVGARRALGVLGTAATTALLVALLLQPTLVPLRVDRTSWLHRAANLVDGSATAVLVDSAVWLARAVYAPPRQARAGVDPSAFDATLDDDPVPLMDRWDRALLDAAGGDRELFARTKAFMWVESGGRQYAVSATGCSGLMQFCASTSQRPPFRTIFGVGQVSACGCSGAACAVPWEVQVALETEPDAVITHAERFPCPLSDARFDPDRSIRAGVAFVRELGAAVGDNLPLMYVGYNAGPAVSRRLHGQLGSDVTIDGLRPHLATALRPHYGTRAAGRAQGLLDVHLPKLVAAYERWRP